MQDVKAGRARRTTLVLLVLAVASLASAGVASAASYSVNDTTDAPLATPGSTTCSSTNGGSCTLRAAVQAADDAGGASAITLPGGTYTLTIPSTGGNNPATGDLDVTNTGPTGTPNPSLTISGAGSGSTTINANGIDRAFAVQTTGALTLSGLSIQNGKTPGTGSGSTGSGYGGAIYAYGPLTLSGDVSLSQNTAQYDGGGIYTNNPFGNYANAFTVVNSTFANNTAGGSNSYQGGGAIYINSYSPMSITGSTFTGNTASAGGGGAILDYGATRGQIDGNRFSNNSASYGGAVNEDGGGGNTDSLSHDEFDNNAATVDGGAYYLVYPGVVSDGSSFINNQAGSGGTGYGGAMYVSNDEGLTLTNATLNGNSAGHGGGIAFYGTGSQQSAARDLINDTIVGNTAGTGQGGGIWATNLVYPDRVGVRNTAVASNSGGDCAATTGGSSFTHGADGGYNLDGDGSCFSGTGAPGDRVGQSPSLAPPASNGGPVLTMAEQPGSPTIDGGTDAACPSTDARGVARPQGASCDIGAYEVINGTSQLSLGQTAPKSATAGSIYRDTITVGNRGPGASTGTTVTDQLPAHSTVYGLSPSQGSCSSTGNPARITCHLGTVASGSGARVSISLSISRVGKVGNTATVSNDQGFSARASATTQIVSIGRLVLQSKRLRVSGGKVHVRFRCASLIACRGKFSIGTHARVSRTGRVGTVLCTQGRTTAFVLRPGQTKTVTGRVPKACLSLIAGAPQNTISAKLTSAPRSGQKAVIALVKLIG